jgi:Xaa-Pro dipeptidase
MTRTYYYKEVSDEHRKIYNLVKEANEEAIKKVKAGVVISTLDDTARDIISAEGYGENFNHRLGHFIGLTDHEFGDVSSVNHNLAEPGNIFSIEPGIYITGDTGVRIEDLVIVTEDGCEVLNHVSKELEIIE